MIDLQAEELIRIGDVPRLLPPSPRTGRPWTRQAVYAWVHGGAGGLRLEAIRIGGVILTSPQAVERFAERKTDLEYRPKGAAV